MYDGPKDCLDHAILEFNLKEVLFRDKKVEIDVSHIHRIQKFWRAYRLKRWLVQTLSEDDERELIGRSLKLKVIKGEKKIFVVTAYWYRNMDQIRFRAVEKGRSEMVVDEIFEDVSGYDEESMHQLGKKKLNNCLLIENEYGNIKIAMNDDNDSFS